MNARIFTNIFYDSPCEEMKTWFDAHKDTHYLINGGGGLRHSTDPWIQKNVHFEDGDNISFLNDKLNEMTVFYYMWKNIKKNDSDFIGYNHYRRVFDLSRYNDKIWNYDIIVSKGLPMVFLKDGKIVQGTVREGYDICHNI